MTESDGRRRPPSESGRQDSDTDATIQFGSGGPEDHDHTINVELSAMQDSSKQDRIGRYRLISELGQGGQGAVYLAEDDRLQRRVALKVLFGGLIHSTEARLRFEREAEATGRLNHPGIARIYEIGEAEGVPFIAMELIEGQSLADRILAARDARDDENASTRSSGTRGVIRMSQSESTSAATSAVTEADDRSLRSTAKFMEACARALHVAHEGGLVHRDIKPGNIMVRPDDSPCILDFGLAHDDASADAALTVSDARFGTPAYMAPEQVRGKTREIDRRTDVWALGATLYECCTLTRPFEAPTQEALFARIKDEEPRAPRSLDPRIPKDLEAIILTALDKDQGRRYATAEDLADDLRRFRDFEPVVARPAGRALKTVRWLQRNRLVATAGSIVMLALLGAAVTFQFKGAEARTALAGKSSALDRESSARAEAEEALTREAAALKETTSALEVVERERNAKQAALTRREKALADYDRLADVNRLESAIAGWGPLYPPSSELLPELRAWHAEHATIADRLDGHRRFLAELRAAALPYSGEEKRRDFAAEMGEMAKVRKVLSETETALSAATGEEERSFLREGRAAVAEDLDELETLVNTGRRSWLLEDEALQFQHDVLAQLVSGLEAFVNDESGPIRSYRRRLEQSQAIAEETIEGERASRWVACKDRVARNPLYVGLDLQPQLGLIPLGPDPDSGLEEFLHWLTHEGPIPVRDLSGKITVNEQLGVILVLIPGGTFLMGGQADDPESSNYDPRAKVAGHANRLNEVTVVAYLLSKYEMSQAQWQRAFQADPSRYTSSGVAGESEVEFPVDGRHPVERVSWTDAQLLLPQIDLTLPTEAEWERAARAGRGDQFLAGCSEVAESHRFANVRETPGGEYEFVHDDGFTIHAPVGSLSPNGFGLFDMSGNVREWCLDGFGPFDVSASGPRGLRHAGTDITPVLRGGSYENVLSNAFVGKRGMMTRSWRRGDCGIRPARVIRKP